MNKSVSFIIILFLLACQVESVSAQGFLNKLSKKVQNKIEKKTEQKVDEKVDQEIDKKLDQAFDSIGNNNSRGRTDEERQNDRMQKMMKGMGFSGEPVPIQDSYGFDYKMQMHVESYDADGKKETDGDFITYLSTEGKDFAYEFVGGDMQQKGKGTFIMDLGNKAMIILSDEDGKKSGIVYGFDMQGMNDSIYDSQAYKDMESGDAANMSMSPYVKKTGRSKSILGYRCKEYKYDNPDDSEKATFWISKDVNIVTRDFMSTLLKSATYSHGMPWGFVMESESEDTKTGERNVMHVTDINTKANKKFMMSNYQITNIGSMKLPSGQ